jgi:hypothetical protein
MSFVVVLNVILLFMKRLYVEYYYAMCRYAECHSAIYVLSLI